jgi:hypothetical protein
MREGDALTSVDCVCPASVGSTESVADTTVGLDGRIKLCVVRSNDRGDLIVDIRINGVLRYVAPNVPTTATNMCITYRPVQGEDSPSEVHQVKLDRLRSAKGALFYDA